VYVNIHGRRQGESLPLTPKNKNNKEGNTMSGFQFIHLENFGRIPGRGFKKQSMRGVAREAERVPGACPHIENPKEFELVYGEMPSKVVEDIHYLAELKRDSRNRKIRNDAQLLLGGVASYPVPMAKLNQNDENFIIWRDRTIKFLKQYFSGNLKSIGCHTDEEYFHFHFYVSPDEDNFHIRSVHPGWAAHDSVKSDKKKDKNIAYNDAMRQFQNEYYESVSRFCGLTRIGPKVQRLSRKEWKYQKEQALALSDLTYRLTTARNHINLLHKEAEKREAQSKQHEIAANKKRDEAFKILNQNRTTWDELQFKKLELNKLEKELVDSVNSNFFKRFNKAVDVLKNKLDKALKLLAYWKSRALNSEHNLQTEMQKVSTLRSENSVLNQSNSQLIDQNTELSRHLDIYKSGIDRLINKQRMIDNHIRLGKTNELRIMIKNNYESDIYSRD
jgi:hypothetical protein